MKKIEKQCHKHHLKNAITISLGQRLEHGDRADETEEPAPSGVGASGRS